MRERQTVIIHERREVPRECNRTTACGNSQVHPLAQDRAGNLLRNLVGGVRHRVWDGHIAAARPVTGFVELEGHRARAVGDVERFRVVARSQRRGSHGDRVHAAGHRLRHDGDDLRGQVQLEVARFVLAVVEDLALLVLKRIDTPPGRVGEILRIQRLSEKGERVLVVGERLGEPDHHVVAAIANADPAEFDELVVAVSKRAVDAADQLDRVERVLGIVVVKELLSFVEA